MLSEEDEGSRLAWAAEVNTGAVSRLTADRVWIVDPLDGTREFSEEGRTDWAVHVALWARSAPSPHGLVAGAVGAAGAAPGAGHRLPAGVPADDRGGGDGRRAAIRLAVSRTRPPVFLTELAEDVGAELVPMGSAGAKIAAVITGEVDAYVHAGGQYEWDSAAPVAVAPATGLHASRIDGSALSYNQADRACPTCWSAARISPPSCLQRCSGIPGSLSACLDMPDRKGLEIDASDRAVHDRPAAYQVSHLDALEAESIYIMREVAAEFERPVLLFSGGKDSIVMLRLAEKAFCAGPHPVPGDARRHRAQLPRGARVPRPAGRRARRCS